MTTEFRKRVSPIEKLYLAFNALRPPFVNQVTIEGRGRLDAAALETAVATATAANPGAALRMRGHLGRRSWVVGPGPRLTFVTGSTWDGRSEVSAPFLDATLDGQHGPSCELQVVEAGARTFLVFRSLHAVMDGLGTLLWAQDVFRALRGEPCVGHPSTLTDAEAAAGLHPDPPVPAAKDAITPCGTADALTSGNAFRWQRVTIDDPDETHFIAAVAVAAAGEARRRGDGPVRFNIPADLRFFHKEERTTGNTVGTIFLDVPPDATVASVAADLKARLKARDHARFPKNYGRMRWIPMSMIHDFAKKELAREHTTGRYLLSGTISYLGVVEPGPLTAPGFTPTSCFWIPPTADQNCFVVGSRFGGHLEVLLAVPKVLASEGRFESLMASLVAALGRPGVAASSRSA